MIFAASAVVASAVVHPYNVVELLQLNPNMDTLVTAVVKGGLAGALSGTGPFTIFAPDNIAFEKLPAGVLPALLANVTLLDEILTYHVVAGNVSSSELKDGEQVPTLLKGESIDVHVRAGPNGASFITLDRDSIVTYPNTFGTNGVYHVIDNVLIPRKHMSAELAAVFDAGYAAEAARAKVALAAPALNLVQRLQLIPEYSTLVTAVVKANLAGVLSGKGPFTIFAPDNFAFDRLPNGVLPKLLANITLLTDILTYHVVAGNVSSSELKDNEQVPTLLKGQDIDVNIVDVPRPVAHKEVFLNKRARVTLPDNFATNGVFHGIDDVLLPHAL